MENSVKGGGTAGVEGGAGGSEQFYYFIGMIANYCHVFEFLLNHSFNLIISIISFMCVSLAYLIICGFAAYFRDITLNPSLLKDWFFFLLIILVVNSMMYSSLVLIFSFSLNYEDLIVNLIFTFLLYVVCANIFEVYQKLVFGSHNV